MGSVHIVKMLKSCAYLQVFRNIFYVIFIIMCRWIIFLLHHLLRYVDSSFFVFIITMLGFYFWIVFRLNTNFISVCNVHLKLGYGFASWQPNPFSFTMFDCLCIFGAQIILVFVVVVAHWLNVRALFFFLLVCYHQFWVKRCVVAANTNSGVKRGVVLGFYKTNSPFLPRNPKWSKKLK